MRCNLIPTVSGVSDQYRENMLATNTDNTDHAYTIVQYLVTMREMLRGGEIPDQLAIVSNRFLLWSLYRHWDIISSI